MRSLPPRSWRDHPTGRAVAPARASNPGSDRRADHDLLPLVRAASGAWSRKPRGPLAQTEPGLEPHPRPGAGAPPCPGARSAELSSRKLAVRFTDQEKYFVCEASVYRLLKAHDLITSPAFIVVKAAEAFTEMTTAPNRFWQTDFTYLEGHRLGARFYLSTILDDYSRFIIAWKLCTTMRAGDVTDTLELALAAAGRDTAIRRSSHRPRLLSDNGASYVAGDLARWLEGQGIAHIRGAPNPPANPRQDRALAPDPEEPRPARELLPARPARGRRRRLRRPLQSPPLPREPRQPDPRRRLLRPRPSPP